jgi:hypothetical protein
MNAHTIYFLFFVILVFDSSKIKGCVVWKDQTASFEVLVSSEEDSVEHGFVKKEVAHPF